MIVAATLALTALATAVWDWVETRDYVPTEAPSGMTQSDLAADTVESGVDTSDRGAVTVYGATPADLVRLGDAAKAYAAAGLELPGVEIWFDTDVENCEDHRGKFSAGAELRRIRICDSTVDSVLAHELAHAWVQANVDEEQRMAFLTERGLDTWGDRDVPWNERGVEWAAVIIQQGVSGLPLPPAPSDDLRSRLTAFELLTGGPAPILLLWIQRQDVGCDYRPTPMSRILKDAMERSCT